MSNVNITPQTVLLTSGQAAKFEATDSNGQPVLVSWSLPAPGGGTLVAPAGNTPAASAIYVAPQLVASGQTIAVVASITSGSGAAGGSGTANDSASATISLTPEAIAIVPAKVDLKADESQDFIAIVAGYPAPSATWILSPLLGALGPGSGGSNDRTVYKAPPEIPESTTVSVIAALPTSSKQAVAVVNLASPPWLGRGVNILGAYLLLVFALVFFMVLLWPPALPSPDTAKANRMEAEKTLQVKTKALEDAEIAAAEAVAVESKLQPEGNKPSPPTATSGTKPDGNATTLEGAKAKAEVAKEVRQRAKEERDEASADLRDKQDVEKTVNAPDVDTRLAGHINRELDLLFLVLLAGSLGSFLHMAQSYSEFIGNRTLKSSWAWWYGLGPFIGAGLALVFYAAVRGGFMAIATGSNAKTSELSPFGLVSVAALVGMFSKDATMKLGDVFDTLFKSDKAQKSKDPLVDSNQPAGKPPVGGAGAPPATK